MLHSDFNISEEKIALQFSGGKDSLACLFLLREHWDNLTIYWTNTGAAFPETVRLMDQIRKLVPDFKEIKTDQHSDIEEYGYPVDVLPIRNAPEMQHLYIKPRVKLQSFLACCWKNIMSPMHERMKADGITLIVRGQRNDEVHQSPLRSGAVCEGFKFWFPIQEWNSDEVRRYVESCEIKLPEHYQYMDTSLDCWNCTAYMEENMGKMKYMKDRHHYKFNVVRDKLRMIGKEIGQDVHHLRECAEC